MSCSSFKTIEILALAIAKCCIVDCCVAKVSKWLIMKITVLVEKPNAIMFADCASVRLTRSCSDYPSTELESRLLDREVGGSVAFIAIGSNIGNRACYIEKSIACLKDNGASSIILFS